MAPILADDNFRCIFLNENDRIPIRISLKFVLKSPINNKPALVLGNGLAPNRRQAITWTNADSVHWCIYAALGVDELMFSDGGSKMYCDSEMHSDYKMCNDCGNKICSDEDGKMDFSGYR